MTKTLRKGIVTFAIVCVAAAASAQGIQSNDQAIAALSSSDQRGRQEAVDYIQQNAPPGTRPQELEAALVRELVRLNDSRRSRRERDRAGLTLGEDFPAEYYAEVIQLVAESSSPATIEPLTGALGTGTMVRKGLSKFGDAAVPAIAAVAQARAGTITAGAPGDTPPEIVADAISTLATIFASRQRISPASRTTMLSIARNRLSGAQHGFVVIAAIELAAAIRDRALLQRVAVLGSVPQEVRAMGVTEPWLAEQVQRAAQLAVKGR